MYKKTIILRNGREENHDVIDMVVLHANGKSGNDEMFCFRNAADWPKHRVEDMH